MRAAARRRSRLPGRDHARRRKARRDPTRRRLATSGIDGSGLAPADLESAYDLPSSTGGSGQTVGLVDAYNDPTAEADLAAYRSAYGLPSCTTAGGCFDKVSQTGGKSYPSQPNSEEGDWPVEESLDLDMVSAICPNCHIMLVEANSASDSDLGDRRERGGHARRHRGQQQLGELGVQRRELLRCASTTRGSDHAASGDYGYDNDEYGAGAPSYPAASPYVIAVGGTNLARLATAAAGARPCGGARAAAAACTRPKPSYQSDSGCSKRTTNDVSAAAEDISIYDTSGTVGEKLPGWYTVGGTSAATPIIAAYEALSGSETRSLGAAALYKNPSSFYPVTSGSNGSCGGSYLCTGGSGYRGPTGVGTPDGVISASAPPPSLAVSSVTPDQGPTAGHTSVTIKGTDFVKGATVKIGGKASSVTVHSETEITAITTAGTAGSDEVVVTDTGGVSSGGPSYTYVAPPKPSVSAISPTGGSTLAGTGVTITGSGFVVRGHGQDRQQSHFGDGRLLDEITAKTASDPAGSDEVVVTDANGVSSGGPSYTYVAPPPPVVSSITPTEGSTTAGTNVTIMGTGFVSGATAKIGSRLTAVTVVSANEITARTPAHVAGSEEVLVSDKDGVSSDGPSYTYIAPPKPTVSAITPAEGSTSGATTVTITGTGFLAGASVRIGSKASSVDVVSATQITAKMPSHAAGSEEVSVTDADGTSSGGPAYVYHTPPAAATTAVTLACTAGQTCAGTLALAIHTAPVSGGTASAHAASLAAPAPQAIGVAAYSIAPGKSATVKLSLNRNGRALLRSLHGRLSVTLSIQGAESQSPETQTQNVRLDLIRGKHGAGRLERSVASPSGGLATVPVGAV